MSKQNRETLKKYFRKGAMPTQNQFEDLIDSMFVRGEDQLDAGHGDLNVQANSQNRLINFFANIQELKSKAIWTINLDEKSENLLISDGEDRTLLSLSAKGRLGIATKNPQHTLDVRGNVAMRGRIGDYKNVWTEGKIAANGKWQVVVGGLPGCDAFEVLASVGNLEKERYAMLQAIAVCARPRTPRFFGLFRRTKNTIQTVQAHNGCCRSKIDLRWKRNDSDNTHQLQIRTRRSFEEGKTIKVSLAKLWHGALEKTKNDE